MLELSLLAALVVFAVLAPGLLRPTGAVAHWVVGWGAAALAGFLPFLGSK